MTSTMRFDESPTKQGMLTEVLRDATASLVVRNQVVALAQYRTNPLGYCIDILHIQPESLDWSLLPEYAAHRWDGTPNPIRTMLDALVAWEDVGVEAATSTQKSFTAAALILWFLSCWEGARVFTFAPKEDQLRLFIWTEIGKLFPKFKEKFPTAELTDLCLRMKGGIDESWAAFGYSVGVRAGEQISSKAQGMHAEHMLLVYEETPGIPMPVIEAGENTATAPHNLRIFLGNPDHQHDSLHIACTSPGVRHIRISALDHPNVVTGREVVPGAVGTKSIERRRLKYGENDRRYLSRVRGISPAEAPEALIKDEWVKRANQRWIERAAVSGGLRPGLPALGVDVANSEHGDEAAIARGFGRRLKEVVAFPCPNANDLGAKVAIEMRADTGIEPEHVGVDSVGVGAGCVNELKRRDYFVRGLNGGAAAIDTIEEEEFNNLRSQMAWRLREDLRLDLIDLPPDEELNVDLITPQWKISNGKVIVESKEDIKKRLPNGRSPNRGDAVMYWNFVREREPDAPAPKASAGRTVRQMIWQEVAGLLHNEDTVSEEERYGFTLRQ